LGLTGEEVFDIPDLSDRVEPRGKLTVRATSPDGKSKEFQGTVRIDSPTVLRRLVAAV
jgi:aconitate hydratase